MACICHLAAPGRGTPHPPQTAPLPTLSPPHQPQPCPAGICSAAGGAIATTPVPREGDAPVSLALFLFWITGNCLRSWSDIQSCKWAMCSLTQILCAQTEMAGSSLDICHAHLPLAAPFPCTAGGSGYTKRKGLFGKSCRAKVLIFLSSKDRQASPETGGKYVYFPISSCFNINS